MNRNNTNLMKHISNEKEQKKHTSMIEIMVV